MICDNGSVSSTRALFMTPNQRGLLQTDESQIGLAWGQ